MITQEEVARIIEPTASGYTKEYALALDKAATILSRVSEYTAELEANQLPKGCVAVCEDRSCYFTPDNAECCTDPKCPIRQQVSPPASESGGAT